MWDIRGFLLLLFIWPPWEFSGLTRFESSGHSSWMGDVLLLFSEAQQMAISTDTVLLGNEAISGFKAPG